MTPTGLIGSTLGGYAIEALLGSGGMASVYRGLDLQLQRPVAVKVLAPHAAAMPGFAERFRQEARLVANLRHPGIVQIYAFGEERGLTYMVQELLPGPTLEQRIQDAAQQGGFLGADEITGIVAQLAAALDAAHAVGVIHRDVKPANALWNAAGILVLTDFGIAKDTLGAVNQTQAGVVMGTPTYMAPEQGQGLPLTPATDIYALGVILYELLAGRVPFDAPTPLAVVLQHIHDPPPPLGAIRPDVPPAVEAVVQRALAKEPGARYASAGALASALRQAWTLPVAGGVHQLATQAWAPPASAPARGAQPAARPATSAPRRAQVAARVAQPPQATPAPVAQRRSQTLPVLAVLLLLAFATGALLALRGTPAEQQALEQPAAAAAEATAAATDALAPTAPMVPAPAGPAAEVRALLAAGADDGRAGPQGETLLATLDAAQQALDQGDTAGATAQLAALQRTLLEEARAGALAPELLRQALSGIDAIADDAQLTLPLAVSAD